MYTEVPLYCGHHWDSLNCPDFRGVLISEYITYSFVHYCCFWDYEKCPDLRGVLISECPDLIGAHTCISVCPDLLYACMKLL